MPNLTPETAVVEQERRLIRGQFLNALELAKSVTEKVELRLPLVKTGLEKVEWISKPLLAKAIEYGDPLLNKADDIAASWLSTTDDEGVETTTSVQAKVQEVAMRIVGNKWFQKVEAEIRFHALWEAARSEFLESRNMSRQEFITGFKARIASAYSGNADVVAEFFWKNCNSLLSTIDGTADLSIPVKDLNALKERLNTMWDLQVTTRWNDKVVSPSVQLYQDSLAYYIDLKTRVGSFKDTQVVSFDEFQNGMRQRLGKAYNDNLEKPLLEFYSAVQSKAVEELTTLQTKVNTVVNKAKIQKDLTVGVLVDGTKRTLETAVEKTMSVPRATYKTVLLKADAALDQYLPLDTTPGDASNTASNMIDQDLKSAEPEISLKSLTVRTFLGVQPYINQFRHWGPMPRIEEELTSRLLHYRKRIDETNNKVVRPKIVSVQQQLKTQYEKFETVTKMPMMKKRAKACTSHLAQLKSMTHDYVTHRPVKKMPADAFKFAYQMPLFVVALLLGATARPTDFPEVENLGIGLFQAMVALLFWFRAEETSREDLTVEMTQANAESAPVVSRPSPASSFDSIASGSEQIHEDNHQNKKSAKKKRRAKHGKHKKPVTPSQGSEPDMTKYHSDDEVVSF